MDKRFSNYEDVYRMHVKHGLPIKTRPTLLNETERGFRESFLREELLEFEDANQRKNLPDAADALIDLAVVTMGTAVMMGLPWEELWRDVQRANMSKVRVTSDRANGGYDLKKPEGWIPPHSSEILEAFCEGVPAPAYGGTPRVITLCGSTRFKEHFERWNKELTLQGHIVLSVGMFGHCEDEPLTETVKAKLDQLHLHKIAMSDEIFVLNVDGYIGESTAKEIAFAGAHGVPIRYLCVEASHDPHP